MLRHRSHSWAAAPSSLSMAYHYVCHLLPLGWVRRASTLCDLLFNHQHTWLRGYELESLLLSLGGASSVDRR